jgi:hypothetical protein
LLEVIGRWYRHQPAANPPGTEMRAAYSFI